MTMYVIVLGMCFPVHPWYVKVGQDEHCHAHVGVYYVHVGEGGGDLHDKDVDSGDDVRRKATICHARWTHLGAIGRLSVQGSSTIRYSDRHDSCCVRRAPS